MTSPFRENGKSDSHATILLLQAELAATNQEVMLLTLELEQRVAERTAQLSKANRSLEREVKERRQAEDAVIKLNHELERRAAELQAANRDLESFTYSVSHDLRGPLRHIGGYAQMLRESFDENDPAGVEECRQAILNQAKKMTQLIDDLLQFSRTGRAQMVFTTLDLNPVVESIIADFRPETESREIEWQISSLPPVYGDANLIRLALTNLLSNAIKYTRRESPAQIEIGSTTNGDHIEIYVKDNGVGFNMKYADKLFGVFERLHGEREFEGTGIGLANVRQIIERHGGQVWAESEEGAGATFHLTLPTPPS